MRSPSLVIVALVMLPHLPAVADAQPVAAPSAFSLPADSLLPVYDWHGAAITEAEIAAVVRPAKFWRRFVNVALMTAVGAVVAMSLPGEGRECSIYEPCSDRDEFNQSVGVPLFLGLGAFVGAALPAGEVTRLEAVSHIRLQRGGHPPEPAP